VVNLIYFLRKQIISYLAKEHLKISTKWLFFVDLKVGNIKFLYQQDFLYNA